MLADAVSLLTVPAAIAAVIGTITGPPLARVLAAAAAAWIAIVAVMAQAGYAGNPRYLVAAMAFGCVLAGVGAAWLGRAIARGATAAPYAVAVVIAAAVGAITLGDLREQIDDVGARADRREALPAVVEAAGGRDRARRLRAHPHRARRAAARRLGAGRLDARDRPPARGAGRGPELEPAQRRAAGAGDPGGLRAARPGAVLGGLGRV